MFAKEDIERLFTNKCSVEEATAIITYLDTNPELITEYLEEDEWEKFKASQTMPRNISKDIWKEVQKHTIQKKATIINLRKLSVAASILIIFLVGIWFLKTRNESIVKIPTKTKSQIKFVSNYTKTKTIVQLSDSSIVELFPNSTLSYQEVFDKEKRNITLVGEALFSVTKDKNRPFMVLSDAITTTVLGTKFKVESYSNENSIKVSLYEGKVVVKPSENSKRTILKDVYLIPGQVFVFNKTSLAAKVSKIVVANNTNTENTKINKGSAITNSGNWYMFNNQPLSEVFTQLENLYNEKIIFNKQDIKGKTFIGKLDKTDSLHHILHSIGLLNNLVITKKPGGYYISKK
ncbi:MAG: FecR family protein [Chitinophagaceae bacterium]|nr:FecR family protein [Chitinophagaceae bacterium]